MTCRCFWYDAPTGTCSIGTDPPVQETCQFQADRIDPMTGKSLPPLPDPPEWDRIRRNPGSL